jgi:hypothetical protein
VVVVVVVVDVVVVVVVVDVLVQDWTTTNRRPVNHGTNLSSG